jgi:hypothetical protein
MKEKDECEGISVELVKAELDKVKKKRLRR